MYDRLIAKSNFTWSFKDTDWFLDIVLNNVDIRHRIFKIKNYKFMTINSIVFDIYKLAKEERTRLENSSVIFTAKKQYLTMNAKNEKIQISLEDEYALKELVEQYKAYDLIGWFHLGKNDKIFKYCTTQKQDIIKKIYPIINLTIRKVIGAKIISPTNPHFEDAINNSWLQIIGYMPKIDTARSMFSIFTAISQNSAINYERMVNRYKYNVIRMSDLNLSNSGEEDEDLFIDTVVSNDPNSEYSFYNFEDDFYNEIELDTIDNEDKIYLENANKDLDDTLDALELPEKTNILQQNVLAHSFEILSGKIKKICHEKIYAEFFADLINHNISDALINKHTPIIMDIMSTATVNPIIINEPKTNTYAYKMFRDWLKEKTNNKMLKHNLDEKDKRDPIKYELINKLTLDECERLKFLKDNKDITISKLIEYKRRCTDFKI